MKKLCIVLILFASQCLYGPCLSAMNRAVNRPGNPSRLVNGSGNPSADPSAESFIVDLYMGDSDRALYDIALYNKFLGLIKPDLKRSLEDDGRKKLHRKLPAGTTSLGLAQIMMHCLDALEKKDTQALLTLYTQYLGQNKHAEFCETVANARILGIEMIVTTAQEFFNNYYKTLIDHNNSSFFVNLIRFQKDRFKELGDINEKDPETGETFLNYAAAQGKFDIVKALLDAGALVDNADNLGITPLRAAAEKGNLEIVTRLLAAKAAINTPDAEGRTPLIVAANEGHLDIVKGLVRAGATQDTRDTSDINALEHAAMNNKDDILRELGGQEARADLSLFKRKLKAGINQRKLLKKIAENPVPVDPKNPKQGASVPQKKAPDSSPAAVVVKDTKSWFSFQRSLVLGVLSMVAYYYFTWQQVAQKDADA